MGLGRKSTGAQCPPHSIPSRLPAVTMTYLCCHWPWPPGQVVCARCLQCEVPLHHPPASTPPLGRKPPLRPWFLCLDDCGPTPSGQSIYINCSGFFAREMVSSPLRICLVIDLYRHGLMLWTFSMQSYPSSPVPMVTYLCHCGFFRLPYFLAGSSFSWGLLISPRVSHLSVEPRFLLLGGF